MAERRGMGRGLSAILPDSASTAGKAGGEVRELPVKSIKPNPDQPRTRFDEEALAGLADSIEASGVIQPLIVRSLEGGDYEIVAGERRWRAAQRAGVEKVPVVVRDSDEADRLEVALIENMVRENLNPIEEARACAALVEDLGLSKEELGRRVGRSRPRISNLIRLLELPDDVLAMLEDGELTEGHGRALLQIPDHGKRRAVAKKAVAEGWTVRQIEQRAREEGEPRKPAATRRALSAEERAAIGSAAERMEAALGEEVRIRPKGDRLVLEVGFDDLSAVEALADKLSSHKRRR